MGSTRSLALKVVLAAVISCGVMTFDVTPAFAQRASGSVNAGTVPPSPAKGPVDGKVGTTDAGGKESGGGEKQPEGLCSGSKPKALEGDPPDDPGESVLTAISTWVGKGAATGLNWALCRIDGKTSPNLGAGDSSNSSSAPNCKKDQLSAGCWFVDQYAVLFGIFVWVMLPLLMISIIHAISKGSMEQLLKSVLVYMPVAFLGSVVAIEIVELLIDITDDMSEVFAIVAVKDTSKFFQNIMDGFTATGTPFFIGLILAILMIAASITMALVLVMREASIYIATAFLPIGFATLVWPATAKYFRTLCEFLFAMIFSKLIIVAGLSLTIASVAGTPASSSTATTQVNGTLNAASSAAADSRGGTEAVSAAGASVIQSAAGATASLNPDWVFKALQAIVMMFVLAGSPAVLMKVAGNFGFGAGGGGSGEVAAAAEAHLNRPGIAKQVIIFGRLRDVARATKGTAQALAEHKRLKSALAETSPEDEFLAGVGAEAKKDAAGNPLTGRDGNRVHTLTDQELDASGVDRAHHPELQRLSQSNDVNDRARAHLAVRMGGDFAGFNPHDQNVLYKAAHDASGAPVGYDAVALLPFEGGNRFHEPGIISRIADAQRAQGARKVTIVAPLNTQRLDEAKQARRLDKAQEQYNRTHRTPGGQPTVRVSFGVHSDPF